MTYTVDINIFDPTDSRLGRHVHHDSRNREYAHPELNVSLGQISWTSALPVSDQANVGACTGFSVLDILGYAKYWGALTAAEQAYLEANLNQAGLAFYHTATVLDSIPGQYPPNDTGSDGPSAAKAGVKMGYFGGYQHAFSVNAFQSALSFGPVMVGTRWDNSMMTPDSQGIIEPNKKSGAAGGHEYVIDGFDTTLDAYHMRNHWTADWGLDGFAWIPRLPFHGLLADQGDVTIPTPLGATPAPTPAPPKPAVDADVVAAYKSLSAWAKRNYVA